MRKLLLFTLGFGTTTALCAYDVLRGCRDIAVWLFLICALLSLLLARGSKTLYGSALLLLGCTAALVWYGVFDAQYLAPARALDGETKYISVRSDDYSFETAYGTAFDGCIQLEGRTYAVRVYLEGSQKITPGQRIVGQFRIRAAAPDAAEASTYYQGEGIFLLAYQGEKISILPPERTWKDAPALLRRDIEDRIEQNFPQDTSPFAKALLLGDSSDLSYETDTDFKRSGIRHVIAVSGLHVSILFAVLGIMTFRKRFLTTIVGLPLLALFAAVAGFTPSVVRACIMSGMMLLAGMFNQEYDGATALSFAVLILLLANPLVILSVSFQLSVASVAGIFLFDLPIRRWILSAFGKQQSRKLVRWLASSVSVSTGAQILTVPLCAVYFGSVSLVGVVTNLLILWIISLIFYGIMGVCLLSLIFSGAAMLLGQLLSWPIRYVLITAKLLGKFPLACVYTQSPYITAWLVFVYLLLLLFLFLNNKRPYILICCSILGLCMALLASWGEAGLSSVRFTVLDVGQGQCLLLQSQRRTYMIDCGGDSDSAAADLAAETLLSQGITRLDGLILTHMDRDHAGAASKFLSRVETELLILPENAVELQNPDGETLWASEELFITLGDAAIRIFPPTFPGNSNENSLCILFESENCVILVTGDRNGFGERSLLRQAEIPDVDIMVAGHHGSGNSTCEELLEATRPEIVCISVGADNSYGHPAPQLLDRLAAFGCTVYRTDLHGTILIRR